MTGLFFSSRLLLMPFYRPETKFYIYIFIFIFFAGLAGFLGYTYFRVQKIDKEFESQTEIFPEKKFPKAQRLLDIAENEAVRFPVQEKEIQEACLVVPLEQNIMKGIKSWKRVTLLSEEKHKQGKDLFYDFVYEGKLKAIEGKQENGCWYYQLVMEKNGADYKLNIPKGVLFTGDFSKVDPLFLQEYVGSSLQVRVQFFSVNKQDFDPLKFVEWEIRDIEK